MKILNRGLSKKWCLPWSRVGGWKEHTYFTIEESGNDVGVSEEWLILTNFSVIDFQYHCVTLRDAFVSMEGYM